MYIIAAYWRYSAAAAGSVDDDDQRFGDSRVSQVWPRVMTDPTESYPS